MPAISSNNHSRSGSLRRPRSATFAFRTLLIFLGFTVASPPAICQSQSSSQPSPSQPPPQQAQPQPPQKDDPSAAAKKTDKDKPKPKRVFTEEDLSSLHGGVSVVGDSSPGAANSAGRGSAMAGNGAGKAGSNITPMSGRDEQYWRGQAKAILDEMAAIDQEITKTKEDIKKYGADGFDANRGYKAGVVYIDNRASKVEQLEKRKAELEKKLDQLQEDGRKAGADPAWFR
jgi:hypothetical protein